MAVHKLKKSLQNVAKSFGYNIIKVDRSGDPFIDATIANNVEFLGIYNKYKSFTMTLRERQYALYKAVKYIVDSKIPGDFVECGVWRGGSAMIMADILLSMGETDRKIYLYDTFKGMSKPNKDEHALMIKDARAIDIWEKKQKEDYNSDCYSPLSEVRRNMLSTGYPENKMVFVQGKVEETIPKSKPKSIALLRLDTDWYESTRHELIHLFPLLSKNGVLIIDDYGSWSGAKKAVDEYFHRKPILLNRIDETGIIGVKTG